MYRQAVFSTYKLKKWLLAVTLLFSIVSCSGYTGYTACEQASPVQTELVLAFKDTAVQRAISFRKLKAAPYSSYTCQSVCGRYATKVLAAYNRLIHVKFHHTLKVAHSFRRPIYFLHISTIPQINEEDKPLLGIV